MIIIHELAVSRAQIYRREDPTLNRSVAVEIELLL